MNVNPARRRALTLSWRGMLAATGALGVSACGTAPAGNEAGFAPDGPVLVGGVSQSGASVGGIAAAGDRAAATPDAVVIDRMTWGASTATMRSVERVGLPVYLQGQLQRTGNDALPPEIAAQIAAMTIVTTPLAQLVADTERQRRDADNAPDDDAKNAARQAYQQRLNQLARESATRFLLRAVYSQRQLQQQLTWFWLNHFNVHQSKANLRVMVGDYEEQAIRPHTLGRFRDLVLATLKHPAMIRYLDNEQNAANRINENYARELMELHTLGVDAGYSQRDVQELARVLTGVGLANPLTPDPPKLRPAVARFYLREGLFEFNPNRHDFGDKQLLGKPLLTQGFGEVEEAVDLLCSTPACARFVSRKLAAFFVSNQPPADLVARMAATFTASGGAIDRVLRTMLESPQFVSSLSPGVFKDPVHYVASAVRLAYDDRPILNAGPMLNWLNRMGEPLYGRQTPDGYPLDEASWASSGQMITRFEIAKAIGGGSAGLFKSDGPQPQERPTFPKLSNALFYQSIESRLGPETRRSLDQAASPQEWNTLLLASPEMMRR